MKQRQIYEREQQEQEIEKQENRYRDNIVDGFRNINRERGMVKRNILEWAYMLAETGRGTDEGSIASRIIKELKKEGLGPAQYNYVYEVLEDDKFKRGYSKDGRHLTDANFSVEKPSEENEIVVNRANQFLEELDEIMKTQDAFVTRDNIKTIYDKVDKLHNYLDKKCDENHIARRNHSIDDIEKQQEQITLKNGIPTPEELEYLKEIAKENYRKIRQIFRIREEKLDTNSPQTVEDWIRLINGQEAFILMFEPMVNERYQRHWLDIAQIAQNYNDYGGTAASSKSKVDTYIINKRTGKPVRRAVTKEHIDNNKEKWIEDIKFMVEHIPILFEEMRKFDNTERTERATRAVELHDRLSEAA